MRLDELVAALTHAFEEGQALGDEQHLRRIERYTNPDGTPITRSILVPDPTPDDPKARKRLDIPLLSLVPASATRLQQIVLDLDPADVEIDDVSAAAPIDPEANGGSEGVSVTLQGAEGDQRRLRIVVEAAPAGDKRAQAADGTDGDRRSGEGSGPSAAPATDPLPVDPAPDVRFTISTRLVDEREIDVRDTAVILVTVGLIQEDTDREWEVEAATLSLDVTRLPSTMTVGVASATWAGEHLAVDLGRLRPGDTREFSITVATGVPETATEPGEYRIDAFVDAQVKRTARAISHELDPIVIEVAAD